MATDLFAAVLAWLGTYLVHSTLLLLAGLLCARLFAFERHRLRERVLRVALVGGLFTASLQVGLGLQPYGGAWAPFPGDSESGSVAEPAVHAAERVPASIQGGNQGATQEESRAALADRENEVERPSPNGEPAREETQPRAGAARGLADARGNGEGRDSDPRAPRSDEPTADEALELPPHEAWTLRSEIPTGQPVISLQRVRDERDLVRPASSPSLARDGSVRDESAGTPREAPELPTSVEPIEVSAPQVEPPASEEPDVELPSPPASDAEAWQPGELGEPRTDESREADRPLPASPPFQGPSAPGGSASVLGGSLQALGAPSSEALGRWVLLSWSVGGTLFLSLLVLALWKLRRRWADRVELKGGELVVMLHALRARTGIRRKVRLSVARSTRSPATFGVWRPEIVVPERALTHLKTDEQRAMLAHELAHVARRDAAWTLAYRVLEGVFFFQPLNRVVRRRLQDEAEYLADDWVVERTGGALSLASCLAEVAGWVVGERRALPVPSMAGPGSRLGVRVERLLDREEGPRPARRGELFTLPVLGLALAGTTVVAPGVLARPLDRTREEPLHEPVLPVLIESAEPVDAPALELFSSAEEPPADAAPWEDAEPQWPFFEEPSSEEPFAEDALSGDSVGEGDAMEARLFALAQLLEWEIESLEAEVADLRPVVGALENDPALRARLASIERGLDELRARRAQLAELLPALFERPLVAPDARIENQTGADQAGKNQAGASQTGETR